MGLVLVLLVALPFDMGAMAFGSLNLVVPFAGMTIISAVFLSSCFLQEEISCFHTLAAIVTAGGVALCAASGARSTKFYTANELEDLMLSPEFMAHASFSVALFSLFAVIACHTEYRTHSKLWCLSYAFMAGISGANLYIILKTLSDFIYLTLYGHNQFQNEWMYFVIVAAVFLAIVNIYCLNVVMKYCDGCWIIPIYQAIITTAWVCLSLFIFEDEFKDMSKMQFLQFLAGLNIVIWGIAALAMRPTCMGHNMYLDDDIGDDDEKKGMMELETKNNFEDQFC